MATRKPFKKGDWITLSSPYLNLWSDDMFHYKDRTFQLTRISTTAGTDTKRIRFNEDGGWVFLSSEARYATEIEIAKAKAEPIRVGDWVFVTSGRGSGDFHQKNRMEGNLYVSH